jgi:hypothetical protein
MSNTGSPVPASYSAAPNRPPSAGSAETLVLVALILQVLGAVIVIALLLLLFGVTAYHLLRVAWVVALVAGVVGAISLLFLFCAYEYSYLRIQRGQYQEAQAPTLVIGILSLFLGLIPGVLYLVGYLKLGDAVREQQIAPLNYGPAFGFPTPPGASAPMVACRQCLRVYVVGRFPFCPNCGQKLGP